VSAGGAVFAYGLALRAREAESGGDESCRGLYGNLATLDDRGCGQRSILSTRSVAWSPLENSECTAEAIATGGAFAFAGATVAAKLEESASLTPRIKLVSGWDVGTFED
jgi:hypothetical protein